MLILTFREVIFTFPEVKRRKVDQYYIRPHAIDFLVRVSHTLIFRAKNKFSDIYFSDICPPQADFFSGSFVDEMVFLLKYSFLRACLCHRITQLHPQRLTP